MNTAELKLSIFRQVDALEETNLQEIFGMITNYLNRQKEIQDWDILAEEQKQGILNAISEIDEGKVIPHERVVSKYKKIYSNVENVL